MKNFILGILTVVVIVGVGFFAYQYGKNQTGKQINNPQISPAIISPTEMLVGNDRDEHGCIGSAGYEWCVAKNKCLRSWEETCIVAVSNNDNDLIKQALVNKHGWKIDDILVTISKNDGKYASGGVREKSSEVGGGYFFAVKDNGTWKIVVDGNGTIDCVALIPYPDYPNTLIPECYDMKAGKSVKR